ATVCLPTYNERENIEAMLRALAPLGVRVLVIDDDSPDGTGEIADRLAGELDFVSVLHRERKEGLGPAYLAGFRRALADGAELILELDCDFSHDPSDVPRLVDACESGADLALGSRYVPGGGPENWGLGRRIVSWGGSFYARVVELDPATFDQTVLGGPVLVDFWAPWCRPCRAIEPILEQLGDRVAVARVNIDEHPGIASRYDVLSIPTVMLFDAGEPRGK